MSEANSLARRAHVAELVIAAREARLEGVELLDGDTDALAAEYNGIGPEWAGETVRGKLTELCKKEGIELYLPPLNLCKRQLTKSPLTGWLVSISCRITAL